MELRPHNCIVLAEEWEGRSMSFPEESHYKAYVCNHVFDQTRPILLVSRADDDWCFLCGDNHPDDASAYKVIGMGHVFDQDPSVRQLGDLPRNWDAERKSVREEWVRRPTSDQGL